MQAAAREALHVDERPKIWPVPGSHTLARPSWVPKPETVDSLLPEAMLEVAVPLDMRQALSAILRKRDKLHFILCLMAEIGCSLTPCEHPVIAQALVYHWPASQQSFCNRHDQVFLHKAGPHDSICTHALLHTCEMTTEQLRQSEGPG